MAYAHIVSMTDDRKAVDAELYAPVDGWEAADARLWEVLDHGLDEQADRDEVA